MEIIDLSQEHEQSYFVCLEEWSQEIQEAGNHKEVWYNKMKDKGLRVKLAVDDNGCAGGMVQYVPVEHSPAEGRDLHFVQCIWVHGHKEGRGNYQKRGMGKALIEAAEADARAVGAKGMAAWGLFIPVWMKASWFKKQGYKKADREGMQVLMWKPFTSDAAPPRWIRRKKKPEKTGGKVTVTAFLNGWCPVQNMVFERAKRAAAEFGDKVVFQEFNTSERAVFQEWGIADGLYIDGKEMRTGPPPSYEKIREWIARRVAKLQGR